MIETALRWGGLVAVAGALLLGAVIVRVAFYPVVTEPFTPGLSLTTLLAAILLVVALPGLYARQAQAAGWLGLAGYGLLQAGLILFVVIAATPLIFPSVRSAVPENPVVFVLGIALTVGLLLTGLATLRAGVFPRWAAVLLLAAMAGFFFNFFVSEFLPPLPGKIGTAFFGILLALALAWMGLSNWSSPVAGLR
jgi:hypothetical protein